MSTSPDPITGVVRPMTPRRQLLEQAIRAVDGDRDQEYGGPESSFSLIASVWSALRSQQYTASDVAMMLAALKLVRLQSTGGEHEDSWVDLAGYAACGYEVRSHRD